MTAGLITYDNTEEYNIIPPNDQLFMHRFVNLYECILHSTTF